MQSYLLADLWPSRVKRKPMLRPVLIALAALFLICLPLRYMPFAFGGIQHPIVTLILLLVITTLSFGVFEVVRQKRVSTTKTTHWLAIAALFALLPSFYQHTLPNAALWQGGITLSALLLFSTLQQFSFNHHQRQFLLWLPLLSGWLLSLTLLAGRWFGEDLSLYIAAIRNNASGFLMMTALSLSAYLLARTKAYKRSWLPVHIILLLTPVMMVFTLLSLESEWLITPLLAVITLTQPFLLRFCAKLLHGLWNISLIAGFFAANAFGVLPHAALFSLPYDEAIQSLINQTWLLFNSSLFEGVGLGQLVSSQLLFGLANDNVLTIPTPYPSWLMASMTEGGLAYVCGLAILIAVITKRLFDAPNGTRMMLLSIVLPLLCALVFTPFIDINPVLGVLLIVLIYWVDNLTARYRRFSFIFGKSAKITTMTVLLLSALTVISSVYLGEQALRAHEIRAHKLSLYQLHPWWQSFYQNEIGKRAFFNSVEKNDKRAQEAYLRQQIRLMAINPDPERYQSLIDLAILTKHQEIAYQVKEEASLLFPKARFEPKRFSRQ